MATQIVLAGVENFERPELVEDRRKILGGSDIAAILGVSPWKTAYELWEEKTAEEVYEPIIEPEREKLYRRGKKLEPWVLELIEEERGILVVRRNQRYCDPEYPFMRCEIDFEYAADDGMCNGEIKTISPFAAAEWGQSGTDEIPTYYCLQALWGLGIKTDRARTLVAGMVGMDDLRLYEVQRDDELIAEVRRRALAFWNDYVLTKIPPPPQTGADANKILTRYGGFVCSGNEEIWRHIKRLKGVKAAQKRLNDAKEAFEMEIKKYLVISAENHGLEQSPKKFVINGPDGKKACSVAMQHRDAYQVAASDFLVMRT